MLIDKKAVVHEFTILIFFALHGHYKVSCYWLPCLCQRPDLYCTRATLSRDKTEMKCLTSNYIHQQLLKENHIDKHFFKQIE